MFKFYNIKLLVHSHFHIVVILCKQKHSGVKIELALNRYAMHFLNNHNYADF